MTPWKTIAMAAAIAAAAGVWAMAPVAHGQTSIWTGDGEAQIVELFGGSSRVGLSVRDVEDEDVKGTKPATPGALVSEVHDDTPAATAGFKTGDVIVEFDGERVRSARQFVRLVQETPSGRKVQAGVMRDGQRVTLSVTPRESDRSHAFHKLRDLQDFGRAFRYRPPSPPAPPKYNDLRPVPPPRPPRVREFDDYYDVFGRSSSRLGISVDELSDQLASYFGTKQGVLVTTVRDDSPAAKAGIKAGDVITSVNGSPIVAPSDLRRRIQQIDDGGEFTIELVRDKKTITVKGKLSSEERRRTFRSIV